MLGILVVVRLAHRNELDRNEHRALVKQLENGMLRVGADASPRHRRGWLQRPASRQS